MEEQKKQSDQPVKPKAPEPKVDRESLKAQKEIKDHQIKTNQIIKK